MKGIVYEEERLLLRVQEALAQIFALEGRGSKSRAAATLGVGRAGISNTLAVDNLTIKRIADIAWAAGYRVNVSIERLR